MIAEAASRWKRDMTRYIARMRWVPRARDPRAVSAPRMIGVIADTHGLVRPEALAALEGVDLILHAGDVGAPEVLDELFAIAPLVVVRGNNDTAAWANALRLTEVVHLDGASIFLVHDTASVSFDPRASGYAAVVHGHSHSPRCEVQAGVLWFNPGSAGPRRFKLPVAVGRLWVESGTITGELITLPG